ncbi:hypothetical protein BDN71DRAFT_1505820 [Pleurotus eryngii]|uniref:F-box domain-containing protein n=1 Tax=Pleurotus eryngii TaxID=5323 RepID=A0A9P5ZXW8_PLEER|nr:hypothetical protein BDN71DRAFT_1505820 [Pleurotus eryngii]
MSNDSELDLPSTAHSPNQVGEFPTDRAQLRSSLDGTDTIANASGLGSTATMHAVVSTSKQTAQNDSHTFDVVVDADDIQPSVLPTTTVRVKSNVYERNHSLAVFVPAPSSFELLRSRVPFASCMGWCSRFRFTSHFASHSNFRGHLPSSLLAPLVSFLLSPPRFAPPTRRRRRIFVFVFGFCAPFGSSWEYESRGVLVAAVEVAGVVGIAGSLTGGGDGLRLARPIVPPLNDPEERRSFLFIDSHSPSFAYDMPDAQRSSSSGVRRSTRTRTSRVATVQQSRPEELADVESSELSELSDEESSDFDEPTHRGKRARLEAKVSPKKHVVSARRKKNLSLLPTVPFDVLMEVCFSYISASPRLHLSPTRVREQVLARLRVADVIALSRTSKEFRGLLLSKRSISVWKAALTAEGCLECPADLSEPEYAVLLFGGTNCFNCGTKGIQRIDFGLRRRLCVRCMKVKLVSEKRFDTLFPGSDHMLLELIPYTHIGGYSHGHSSNGRFFYRDDIVKTQNTLKALERAEDPKTATNEFYKAQRDRTWAIISTLRKYETWAEHAADRKVVESESRAAQRWEDIQQRFRILGYIDEDIAAIKSHPNVKSDTPLTNQGWGRVRARLEDLVLDAKKVRIDKCRGAALSDAYTKYMRTLCPTQWAALPRTRELRTLAEVQTLLQRDLDADIATDEFSDLLNDDSTLQTWIDGRQRYLESVIASSLSSTGTNSLSSTSVEHVFVCTAPDCRQSDSALWGSGKRMFISLPEALRHRCESTWLHARSLEPDRFEFAYPTRASAAVGHILSLLKLSPTTTTTTELDKLENLFVCCKCTPRVRTKDSKPLAMFEVFTWREAVLHYYKDCIADLRADITDPQFTRTSPLDPNLQGDDSPAAHKNIWSCLHCAIHLHSWVNRHEVIAHVKSAHPIADPAEHVDFFADPLAGERPASQWRLCLPQGTEPSPALRGLVVAMNQPVKPAALADPKQQFRCKLCSSSSTRRFILGGVQSHIRDVHKVPPQSQRANEHFEEA